MVNIVESMATKLAEMSTFLWFDISLKIDFILIIG